MSCERKGRCLVQEVPEKQSSGDDDRRQIPVIKESTGWLIITKTGRKLVKSL